MVKLSKQEGGSIRTLTAKHLVVDWSGFNNLFYHMTKKQFLSGLKKGTVVVKQQNRNYSPELISFMLILSPTGAMSIGCEDFTREDVRKIKRWAKEGK